MNRKLMGSLYWIILTILFIISFLSKGYIATIPVIYILGYISIPILLFTGVKEIKENNKLYGYINILISLGLIFISIKYFIK